MNNLNYFTKFTRWGTLLLALALTGCATRPPVDLTPVTVNHASVASAWEMQGKLAVRTPEDTFSTNLYWLHTQDSDSLTLTTMLGTTVMSLKNDTDGAILALDGKQYRDQDAERLLKRLTGWSIPVDTLPLWITGQVGTDDNLVNYDDQGRPQQLTKHAGLSSWTVNFTRWQQQSGAEVPRSLQLRRDDIRLKIQINQWQALAPLPSTANNAGH